MREKVGKSRTTVFSMICGSKGSKSRLAKAAGAEPSGQAKDEKLHAVVAQSTFPSQNVKNTPGADHCWKLRVHAVVARSTFGGQNVQNTPAPDHFWKLRRRKSARRCGAKHISKSKCTKHQRSDHFWKSRCWKSARRCGAKHILKSKCTKHTIPFGGSDVASLQDTTLQDITLHYTPVHYITLKYTPVHSTTLNYTTPHYITLNDLER